MARRLRRLRVFITASVVLISLVFVVPVLLPVDASWYYGNLNWLIPLIVVIFIAPTLPLILDDWELHFTFCPDDSRGGIVFTIENLGKVPFNFNRIQVTSTDWLRRKRRAPSEGFFGDDVELHGADTTSRILHDHVGATIEKGKPITFHLRGGDLANSMLAIDSKSKVRLRLYYSGTKQEAFSPRLPCSQIALLREKATLQPESVSRC